MEWLAVCEYSLEDMASSVIARSLWLDGYYGLFHVRGKPRKGSGRPVFPALLDRRDCPGQARMEECEDVKTCVWRGRKKVSH
jgi:hypothetical protein